MAARSLAVNRLLKRYMGGSAKFVTTSSSKVALPITPNLSSFSVHLKVYLQEGGLNGFKIIDWSGGWDRNGFVVKYDTSARKLVCVASGASAPEAVLTSIKIIPFNKWHDITVTYSPNSLKFYVNGVLEGSDTSVVITTNATPITIGSSSYSAESYATMKAVDFSLFASVLTIGQIKQLIATGEAGVTPTNFFPLSDQPSTYIDTIGGATGTGTDTTYSPDVPTQQPVAIDNAAGSSLSFDGASYINVPLTTSLDVTGAFSFVAMVKNKGSAIQDIIRIGTAQFKILRISASGYPMVRAVGKTDLTANNPLDRGWNMIVGTYDLTNFNIYINGRLNKQQANTGTITASDGNIGIGAQYGGGQPFSGFIKFAKIYNTALTAEQIKNLYFNNIVPTNGLVGEWLLNEGTGTTAYDSSGNGNDGTITGATWSADVPSKARTPVSIPRTAVS